MAFAARRDGAAGGDAVNVNVGGIPAELREIPRWVLWRYVKRDGRPTKPPFQIDGRPADVTELETWTSFDRAHAALTNGGGSDFAGVGFVLTDEDDLVAWDLDHCIDAKGSLALKPWAEEIVRRLNSYTEVTPSGEGLRIVVRASLPDGGNKVGDVEVYKNKRYLTFTGNVWPDSPATIEARESENAAMFEKFIRRGAGRAPSGEGDELARLLAGDWRGRYPSRSEADLAACRLLAGRCGTDPARVDEEFRRSKLMRRKWDERHGAATYGERTIRKAIELAAADVHLTDKGNAERFARDHRGELRFRYEKQDWVYYDGRRWADDDSGESERRAKRTVERMHVGAAGVADADRRKELRRWALGSESAGRLKAMRELARSELPVTPDELDRDPWPLTVLNGTIDLRTGELREHRPEDLITKLAPVDYDPAARCPRFEAFLDYFMRGRRPLVEFIRRAIGYSLTGETVEHVMFILHGPGRAGKTTFVTAIESVLGEYALSTPAETLLVSGYREGGDASEDVARLHGARFVVASETDEGRRLSEARVKLLTGGDKVTARYLYGHLFSFRPTFKFWYVTNHLPEIRASDEAIWRRIVKVPFDVQLPEKEKDPHYFENVLRPELPGILAWAVAGCLEWRRRGLDPPMEVSTAVAEYREEQDVVAAFVAERCHIGDALMTDAGPLYRDFRFWSGERGDKPMGSTPFGRRLNEKGFTRCDASGRAGPSGKKRRGLTLVKDPRVLGDES